METFETQLIYGLVGGVIIGLLFAWAVGKDAENRGKGAGEALAWSIAVWFLPLVFIPVWLIVRGPTVDRRAKQPQDRDELLRLAFLRERGLITEAEFSAKKERLLGV